MSAALAPELSAWLRLTLTPGVGSGTARRLLAVFGMPQGVFMASEAALCQVVTAAQARLLLTEPDDLPVALEQAQQWLAGAGTGGPGSGASGRAVHRRILTLGDPGYPDCLLQMEDPPVLLYTLGAAVLGDVAQAPGAPRHHMNRSLAMVGSRNPSAQGALNAQRFGQDLAQRGLTIVSGMALGVDAAAHEGALAAPSLPGVVPTIAVVGTGLDRVYPKQHRDLAHRIAERGLLVSEYPLGTPPLAQNFPRRNRLIAGLSCGTLVVEAALQSGSLITARLALEQGKEVFAIPGSIHAVQSRGCHALIRQGAKLVESAEDVLEELPVQEVLPLQASGRTAANRSGTIPENQPVPDGPAPMAESADADGLMVDASTALVQALGHDPVSLDALQARTGLPTPELQAQLLMLELEGQVARLPGGLFQRTHSS